MFDSGVFREHSAWPWTCGHDLLRLGGGLRYGSALGDRLGCGSAMGVRQGY